MNPFIMRSITALILGVLFWIALAYLPPLYFSFILIAILCCIIVFEWTSLFDRKQVPFWLIMPLYPVLPFIFLIALNHNPLYHQLLFIIFIIVSSFDTGSYMIGSYCGKNIIARTISPRKTWEGFLGGYTFACIGLAWILWEFGKPVNLHVIAWFCLLICLLALAGDFFESWLKRRARLKDAGTLLPGHGGFLDRFDGIMFAVIFFYIFKDWIVELFKLQ